MNKYNIGDFGIAKFKLKDGITGFCGHGTILQCDNKYILFKDNDDFQYLVEREKFDFGKIPIK
jgi:hypothetical protein